jgi:dipeptidyl aminopeptidase/acylaminoacyl peptidase
MTSGSPLTYQLPPKPIADVIDAPDPPDVSLSPDRRWLLLLGKPGYPPIAELAEPELRLAGLRINPRTNGPSRAGHYTGLTLVPLEDGRPGPPCEVAGIPADARIGGVRWSPDSSHIGFTVTEEHAIRLWLVDVAAATARPLAPSLQLNAVAGATYDWAADSASVICRAVPNGRAAPPEAPTVPVGPVVEENIGRVAPARTYQDLLASPHDEALFEHYLQTQVVRVSLDGVVTPLGAPDLITRADPSPDDEYLLLETIHRPYSYIVPIGRFPQRLDVWDREGRLVRHLADVPLAEEVPIVFDAVPTGPRGVHWRQDTDATLSWVEALDGGDSRVEAEARDRVFMLTAPFSGDPLVLADLELRYGGTSWGDGGRALVSERWWKTRRTRTWIVAPDRVATAPGSDLRVAERVAEPLFDRSWEDRYNAPGVPLRRTTPRGTHVLRTGPDGQTLFLAGDGASHEGDRPFLDTLRLDTRDTERLFHSAPPYFERPVTLLDEEGLRIITRRETVSEPPNLFVRDLSSRSLTQITHFPHPAPALIRVQKELIRYRRADGVDLTGKLYLPPDYSANQGPLPLLMWAYPQEFKDADAAGQVRGSPHQFVRLPWSSPLFFLLHGYAVLDNPSMPIVGEGEKEPNDTYVEQLVANAQAAVDEVVRRGVTDPGRIAVGGHSYGGFMTANLLAHSDLFRAGIARSGAYNRTLTPFGFQSEERTIWQAPDIYAAMSPFMHADKIKAPLLLIHGQADNNPGTFTLQSERLYHALKGLGATVRLVLLPHESHAYRARESILHMLQEMTIWLDKYVKEAP